MKMSDPTSMPTMVHISGGNSETRAHFKGEINNLICVKHLFSPALDNSRKLVFFLLSFKRTQRILRYCVSKQ